MWWLQAPWKVENLEVMGIEMVLCQMLSYFQGGEKAHLLQNLLIFTVFMYIFIFESFLEVSDHLNSY